MEEKYQYITDRKSLNRLLTEALRSKILFVDSEWFSHRVSSSTCHERFFYHRFVALQIVILPIYLSVRLLQIATTGEKCWLIDLKALLSGPNSDGARTHVVWFLRQLLGSEIVKLRKFFFPCLYHHMLRRIV
jgi:hypothetical protein